LLRIFSDSLLEYITKNKSPGNPEISKSRKQPRQEWQRAHFRDPFKVVSIEYLVIQKGLP